MKNSKTIVSLNTAKVGMRKRFRAFLAAAFSVIMAFCFITSAFAAETTPVDAGGANPFDILTNLTSLIFSVIQAVGVLMFVFGIVQLALGFQSHDPPQRGQATLVLIGGLLLFSVRFIINFIAPGTV